MKIITFDDIKKLNIQNGTYYKWIEEIITKKDSTCLPPKISMKQEGHIFYNVMPCIIPDENVAGVKLVTRFPNREPSLDGDIMIYSTESGQLLSVMDGIYITAMRTGAMAALAIQTLAVDNYYELGIVGLGNTARSTLLILLDQIGNREIKIKLFKYKGQEKLFIERFSRYSNITFEVVDSYEELIRNSDVVLSCVTYFEGNISEDEWYKKGCLLVPVHTMGFQNCDLFFDRVIVDDKGHVENFKNYNKFKYCCELSDVLNKKSIGRLNQEERIIAYNIGISIEDIYFAKKIYDLIDNKTDVMLKELKDKFWV